MWLKVKLGISFSTILGRRIGVLGKVPRMALRIGQKVKEERIVVETMMAHQAWTLMVSSNPTGIK